MKTGKILGWVGVGLGFLFAFVSSSVVSSGNPDCSNCWTRIWIVVSIAVVTAGLLLVMNRWQRQASLLLIGVGVVGVILLIILEGTYTAVGALLTAVSGLLTLKGEPVRP